MKVINKNIQAARALAVCMVLYIHAVQFLPSAYLKDTYFVTHLTSWVWGGAGVDLFFVISGYVIWMNIGEYRNIAQYMKARFIRVAPLYWIMTLLFAAYSYALSNDFRVTYQTINAGTVIKSLLFMQDIQANGVRQPVLPVGWSLNYEFLFYILAGFVYFINGKLKIFSFLLVVLSIALVYNGVYAPYIFTFLVGVFLQRYLIKSNDHNPFLCLIFFAIAVPFFVSSAEPYMTGGVLRTVVWGLGSGFLFLSFYYLPAFFCKLAIVKIGDASYSIYLAHWFFRYINIYDYELSYLGVYAAVVINIFIMLVVGFFVYYVLEMPLIGFFKSKLGYDKKN